MKFIESIDKIMVKREYEIDLENEKYFKMNLIVLDFFNISTENKVHFKTIEKYNEYKDNKLTDSEKEIYIKIIKKS